MRRQKAGPGGGAPPATSRPARPGSFPLGPSLIWFFEVTVLRTSARQCGRDLEECERGRVEKKESGDPGDARCSTKGAGAGLRRTPHLPGCRGTPGGWQRVRARRRSAQARAGRGKSAGTSLPAQEARGGLGVWVLRGQRAEADRR